MQHNPQSITDPQSNINDLYTSLRERPPLRYQMEGISNRINENFVKVP